MEGNQAVDQRYLNFPIILLSNSVIDPQRVDDICIWQLVDYSHHCRREVEACAIKLLAEVIQDPHLSLPVGVRDITALESFKSLVAMGRDAWGMGGGDFNEGMRVLIDEDSNESLVNSLTGFQKNQLVEWDALKGAARYFSRKIDDHDVFRQRAAFLQEQINQHQREAGKPVFTSLPAKFYYEVLDGAKDLESVRLLRVVAAVRSLLGQREYSRTNKDMIRARMLGAKSPAVQHELIMEHPAMTQEAAQLASRKRFDRIFDKAAQRRFFTKVGLERCILISTTIKVHEQLVSKAKRNHRSGMLEAERLARKQARVFRGSNRASTGHQ